MRGLTPPLLKFILTLLAVRLIAAVLGGYISTLLLSLLVKGSKR